ncbi:PREDICTED: rRNA-processing protein UTP23 homolog, partial [Nicrophorus vespilloides]|uniref:rRNA-processing protein UTP23 homolog n=1 Tax=Nicrophorus vespilloides TaxID=110193 RepID=A0ABM1N0L9_NICVS
MKIRRYKKVSKFLSFYKNSFGFKTPYQVLVDGTFCYAALENHINIANDIPRYLHDEVKFLTTYCALIETEELGKQVGGAKVIQKQYALHKCGHEGKAIPGDKCFLSMVKKKNPQHYIIATQDKDLQKRLQRLPGVPVIYLNMKTPILLPPSHASEKATQKQSNAVVQAQKTNIDLMKKQKGLLVEGADKPKKRKLKGPNPLSCKKKQNPTKVDESINKVEDGKVEKRSRKKIRIPKHVKELLINNVNNQ